MRYLLLLAQSPSSYHVTHTYTLGGDGSRDYVVPDPPNHLSDYQAARMGTTVPIGVGVDGAGYDPASGNAFASNADGTLTVIHQESADKYRVAQTIQTPRGSRNMGLDPKNHRLYVASAEFGSVPAGGRRGPVIAGSCAMLVIEQ